MCIILFRFFKSVQFLYEKKGIKKTILSHNTFYFRNFRLKLYTSIRTVDNGFSVPLVLRSHYDKR